MNRLSLFLSLLFLLAAAAVTTSAQTPPADSSPQQPPSPYYPAPPPQEAPKVEQGAPLTGLTSPLTEEEKKVTRTAIDSDAEAQLFANAAKIVWGRYAKIKGAKPGSVSVTGQGGLWIVKGRIDSVAPGTEGDWASIDAVVERISANKVVLRGEVAFRVAKIDNGSPCKLAGVLQFRRSGKSQVWRLLEGDNPCDGTQELFDLVYEKPAPQKKPVPAPKKN
jgi:hypothetical protein